MTDGHNNYRERGDCVVLYADNYINDIEGENLEEMCDAFIKKGFRKVVVDFSSTDLINSIGVSILIGIMEKIKDKNCEIMFSGLKQVNTTIFDIVGLTKYIRVFGTEDEAVAGTERAGGFEGGVNV